MRDKFQGISPQHMAKKYGTKNWLYKIYPLENPHQFPTEKPGQKSNL
jgi:hypothetical protein